MTAPALVIAGGVMVVAGVTIAFHQLVYEPHIAPKLEAFIEEWLEERETDRHHLVSPFETDRFDRERTRSPGTLRDGRNGLEMRNISAPLRVTAIDARSSTTHYPLRHRVRGSGGHDPSVLESPNPFIPFTALVPASSSSQVSTPSTISSSLLALQSPVLRGDSPARIENNGDHSQSSSRLVDSILGHTDPLPSASPAHSVTQISPRTLFIAIDSSEPQTDDEETRPLSEIQRRATVPALHPPGDSTRSSSPGTSTPYESFATPTSANTVTQNPFSAALPDTSGASHSGRHSPVSTTSWSDLASDSGDEPGLLVSSDNESWASVGDRMS